MDNYSSPNCDRLRRSVSKIIKRLLGGAIKITDRQHMVSCLVYIGAVKDNSGTGMVSNHIIFHFVWKSMWLSVGFIRIRKNGPKVNSQPMLKKKDDSSG